MTAQQMIEKLQKFPPEAQVFLDYGDPRGCVTVEEVVSNEPSARGDAYLLTEAAVKLSKAAHRMTFGAPPVPTGPRLS